MAVAEASFLLREVLDIFCIDFIRITTDIDQLQCTASIGTESGIPRIRNSKYCWLSGSLAGSMQLCLQERGDAYRPGIN